MHPGGFFVVGALDPGGSGAPAEAVNPGRRDRSDGPQRETHLAPRPARAHVARMMLRIYLMGLVILGIAIVLNGVVNRLGILGWYDFLLALGEAERRAHLKLRLIDGLWLFLLYPALLGAAAVMADRVLGAVGIHP
jgi:hypothetical protein